MTAKKIVTQERATLAITKLFAKWERYVIKQNFAHSVIALGFIAFICAGVAMFPGFSPSYVAAPLGMTAGALLAYGVQAKMANGRRAAKLAATVTSRFDWTKWKDPSGRVGTFTKLDLGKKQIELTFEPGDVVAFDARMLSLVPETDAVDPQQTA